jgi:hypothetical protein
MVRRREAAYGFALHPCGKELLVRRTLARLAVLVAMFVVAASPVAAGDELSATLDGRRLRVDRVAEFNCHDFDYPVIRCFSSPTELATDVAAHVAARATSLTLLGGYVTVYQDASYGGASIALSTDQQFLTAIGWNDKISSFQSSGAVGNFREHSPAGGFFYAYGSTTQIPSLSGAYNDKFSAFYIN